MQIKTNYSLLDINKGLGFTFFLLLFWGFILYSFLLLFELIPPVFGGFFGIFSAIACVVFLITSVQTVKSSYLASPVFSLSAFFAFAFASVSTIASSFYNDLRPATIQSLEMLVFWIAMYSIGFYLPLVKKELLKKISIFLSILFLIYTVSYLSTSGAYMLPFGTKEVSNENISGYQSLARNILIISFLVIAFTKKRVLQLACTIMFAIILFAIGSRSEFYGFLAAILVYQLILATKVKSSLIGLIIFFSLIFTIFIFNYESFMDSRQLNVLNIKTDDSWVLRKQMEDFAVSTISDHFLFGGFGEHLKFSGGNVLGAYAHNALSAYANYGLLFFILYVFMCYIPVIYTAIKFKNDIYNNNWAFCFLLCFAIAFLITTTKPVFWPATYFTWGVFLGTILLTKKQVKKAEL